MDQELQDLLAAWHGADVRAARREELLEKLRADEDFRARFAEEITLLSELKTVQSTDPRWLRVADSLGWESEDAASDGARKQDPDGVFADAILERIRNEGAGGAIGRVSPRRLWIMAAAAIVLIGLGLGLFRPWNHHPQEQAKDDAEKQPLAVLLGAADVKWQDGMTPPRVGDTLNQGLLGATSGRFTFSMLSGVTISAEAPVELDLTALDTVICKRGKLRVRVPHGAEGFSVNSPECTVVDRGTEFGVNISPGLPTDVMVFDGRADVFVENNSRGGKVGTSIEESEAVRVTPGANLPARISARAVDFTTMLPAEVVPLSLPPGYRDLILAARPWGYWRFENDQNGLFENEVAGGSSFVKYGEVGFRQHSSQNRSLLFPGEGGDGKSHLALDGAWSPPDSGYAIELWFEAENFSNSTLVSMLADSLPQPHNWHHVVVEVVANKQEMGSVRFLHRSPAGTSMGVDLSARRIYVPCRWNHLVAQRNGDRLQLFLDGELVNETVMDPGQHISPCQVILGRLLKPEFNATPNMLRMFRGGLDEVAFYNRPLTPEEIRSHREVARSNGKP